MTYGYCRISTSKQSIDRQIRNIKSEYPDAIIVQEEYTGTKMARPQWQRLYRRLKAGDVVVFDSVSRMSRNADDGFTTYKELYDKGIELVFLKEHYIDTSTFTQAANMQIAEIATGDAIADDLVSGITQAIKTYIMRLAERQILIAFQQSEKEVQDLHQRTREGIETARLKGKQIGGIKGSTFTTKKGRAAKETIREHSRTFGGTLNDRDCQKLAGVSRNSFYKYKREIIAEDAGEITSA